MLPDLTRRRASAWRSLRHRKERRLLDAIALSSWVSGDGAGVIWWSLMQRHGFWQLLARVGFDGEEEQRRQDLFSRRKIYVSLTRSLEQLNIYYQDSGNRFVSELLDINRTILSRH